MRNGTNKEGEITVCHSIIKRGDEICFRRTKPGEDVTFVMKEGGLPWAGIRRDCIEDAAEGRNMSTEVIESRLESGKRVSWTTRARVRPVVIKMIDD